MRDIKKIWTILGVIVCMAFLLSACGKKEETVVEPVEESSTLPEGMCLVTFQYDGKEMARTIKEGDLVEAPTWEAPENTLLEWVNERGQLIDLSTTPIMSSCTLSGVLYPEVRFGEPFLKLKNGMLYPEIPLSGEDLQEAVLALSAEGEIQEQTLILIPETDQMEEEDVKIILSNIIPAYIVESAFEAKDTILIGPAAVGSQVDEMYPVTEIEEEEVPEQSTEETAANSAAANSAAANSAAQESSAATNNSSTTTDSSATSSSTTANNSSTATNSSTTSSSSAQEESASLMVPAPVAVPNTFTRADLARVMEVIRQIYCEGEEVHFRDFAEIPMDLDLEKENMDALLLASIPYTLGEITEEEIMDLSEEEAEVVEESVEESSETSASADSSAADASSSGSDSSTANNSTSTTADSNASTASTTTDSSAAESSVVEEPVVIEAPVIESVLVQQLLETKWTPGYHVIGGYLYYAQEDGTLMKNDHRGFHLYFDNNGRFTSGSKYINELVAERLMMFIATRPAGTRDEWLREAFDYVTHNVFYVAGPITFLGDTCDDEQWYLEAAVHGLRDWSGNCYDYAAAFTALARGLGYDAHAIAGQALMEHHEHSWVMMRQEEDGDLLCYDPQLEWRGAIMHERDNYGATMFGLKQSVCVRSWMYVYYNPEYPCARWKLPVVDDSRFLE